MTDREKIPSPGFDRPHVVILGAGASFAAFENGDKYGRKLPLMWNIIDIVGLSDFLNDAGLTKNHDNFELLYSNLVTSGQHPDVVARIDRAIFDYFAEMKLPDEPTLYDHLVLSLRSKDVIATFNWDPFLWQARVRNRRLGTLPKVLFLHGNTAIGCCKAHTPVYVSSHGQKCKHCQIRLEDSRLLYPVTQKDYTSDSLIVGTWSTLKRELEDAYLVTIFGYSAPKTDVEAVGLLKIAWGNSYERSLEEIEIIDIKTDAELSATWDSFIHSHHYQTTKSFFNSILSRHPRRSCEAMWSGLMDMDPIEPNPAPQMSEWDGFNAFYEILIRDEDMVDPIV